MHRGLLNLSTLGTELYPIYENMVIYDIKNNQLDSIFHQIEMISKQIIEELIKQGLSDLESDYLCDHGPIIQKKIKNSTLRSLHVMAG